MAFMRATGMVFGGLMRTALTNERLFLMGITSIALSVASGWTTFEGMTNFTRSPVLCFLITFGVQGIMLVSSWMIGESSAISKKAPQTTEYPEYEPSPVKKAPSSFLKKLLLWVVFLFAMAISVFFSFDSLFSSIFSDDERQRAGEIRAQSQVSGVLTDLSKRVETRKFEAVDTLFKSEGWQEYNARMDKLAKIAREAPELVEQQLLSKMRGEQAEIARHQETLAQAKGQKAGIKAQQSKIEQNITRLKSDRPGLSAEVEQLRQQLREKQRLIDQTLAEAAKEARGIGATGREGEGPQLRALKKEERRLVAERDVLNTQKNLASTRLEQLDNNIAKLSQELALINGEVAKIEAKANVAQQFIDAQTKRQSATIVEDLSATASIDSLDEARDRFRQEPNQATFLSIQKNCTNLHNALAEVPKIAADIRSISCESGAAAATIAARIFTLQAAEKQLSANCTIGQGSEATRIDSLLKLGQNCIQGAGLPEQDANEFRSILSRINLNRDDKAKNFVVTLNAFDDGNWLAYLALGLAIAIDSLVFISGMIGAKTAAYENTGSPAEIMKYGLGMSTDIYGHEPNDIKTNKIFFRAISGPSPLPGYLAVIDMSNLQKDEKPHVNKVLAIAGENIRIDKHNPSAYHVEQTFYQNLARQVYLWDQFNGPKLEKPKLPKKAAKTKNRRTMQQQEPVKHSEGFFLGASKNAITKKGDKVSNFISTGPKQRDAVESDNIEEKTVVGETASSVPLIDRQDQKSIGFIQPKRWMKAIFQNTLKKDKQSDQSDNQASSKFEETEVMVESSDLGQNPAHNPASSLNNLIPEPPTNDNIVTTNVENKDVDSEKSS